MWLNTGIKKWGQTCWSYPNTLSTNDWTQYPPGTGAWSGVCSNSKVDTSDDFLRAYLLWQEEEGCVLCCGLVTCRGLVLSQCSQCFEHRIGKRAVSCAFWSALVPVATVETGETAISHGIRHWLVMAFTCICPANFHWLPRFITQHCKLAVKDLEQAFLSWM